MGSFGGKFGAELKAKFHLIKVAQNLLKACRSVHKSAIPLLFFYNMLVIGALEIHI